MSATISGDSFGSFSRAGAIGTLNPAARGGRDFAELLGIAERGALRSELTPEQRARDTAERFIASAFVKPLLDSFSELSDPAPPFQRTQADKQFGSILNGTVALEVVRSTGWSVVDDVAAGLLSKARPSQETI